MQLMELVVCTQTVRTGSDSWLGALIDSSFWGIVKSLVKLLLLFDSFQDTKFAEPVANQN